MRDIFRQSKMWHTPSKLKDNYEVVIIGGGVGGCSIAYHLTLMRWKDVGILEKQQRALGSALYRPGPLSWRDDMVQALGVWVVDRLGL